MSFPLDPRCPEPPLETRMAHLSRAHLAWTGTLNRAILQKTDYGPATPIDRSTVLAEVYPGAANDIERMVRAGGGMVCEEHPGKPAHHDDCGAPGMIRADAINMLRVRAAGTITAIRGVAIGMGMQDQARALHDAQARILSA